MVAILGANSVSGGGYEIDNSLRFNKGDSPDLNRTPSSSSNRKTWTFSCWVKRANLTSAGTDQSIFSAGGNVFNRRVDFNINVNHKLTLFMDGRLDGASYYSFIADRLMRDVSAWYHLMAVMDTTNPTADDRLKLYVNGERQSGAYQYGHGAPPLNSDWYVNSTYEHDIGDGHHDTVSQYWDGYIAETHFIDGQALTPTDFGEVNDNGVWTPKAYEGTYGTNGFFLEFKETGTGTDASGMGADTSGNDNHFAVTNLAALDVMPDTPTNNWCTYNPLDLGQSSSGATFSQGNLSVSTTTAFEDQVGSTFGVSSGKWYWETKIQSGRQREAIGAILVGTGLTGGAARVQYYSRYGTIILLNSLIATGATYGDNDIISVTLDLDNNVVKFYKNNVLQGTVNSLPAATWVPAYFDNSNGVGALAVATNFGQDGTFSGLETAGNNADENGYGNFKYAVPSGFYSLCTKNLAEFG